MSLSQPVLCDVLPDEKFGNFLQSNVNVSHVKFLNTHNLSRLDSTPSLGNIQSTKGKQVNSETLSKRWNIDQRKAGQVVSIQDFDMREIDI